MTDRRHLERAFVLHATARGKPLVKLVMRALEPTFLAAEDDRFDFDPPSEGKRAEIGSALVGVGAADVGLRVAFCPCDEPFARPEWMGEDHWRQVKYRLVTTNIRAGQLRIHLNAFAMRPAGYMANRLRAASVASFRQAYVERLLVRMNRWFYGWLAGNFAYAHLLCSAAMGEGEKAEAIGRLVVATARNPIVGVTMGAERRWIALCR